MMSKLGRVFTGAVALAIAAGFSSPSAMARDLNLTAAGIPYVYRYASCVFQDPASRVVDCSEVRKTIEIESQETLKHWHRGSVLHRGRQFHRALDLIDAEAAQLAVAGGSVPAPIIAYLRCMGEAVSEDPPFTSGSSIDYVTIEPACADRVSAENSGSEEWRGHYLYHRLRRDGRVINTARHSLPTRTFPRGLLDIRRLVQR